MDKNHQKGTKMGNFGRFVKNRPPPSNQRTKIGSRVLFWSLWMCGTQIHPCSSISVSNKHLVPFLTSKIVYLWAFWGEIEHPQKEAFLVENAVFHQKQHGFFSKIKSRPCRGPQKKNGDRILKEYWWRSRFRYFKFFWALIFFLDLPEKFTLLVYST